MGRAEARRNLTQRMIVALENQLKHVPEDARARVLLGAYYAELGREEEAKHDANEASILYNAAASTAS